MDEPAPKPRRGPVEIPPYLLVAPDLSDEEITTLARIIIGTLPPTTPIRSSARPSEN